MPRLRVSRIVFAATALLSVMALAVPAIASAHIANGSYSLKTVDLAASPGQRPSVWLKCGRGKRVVTGGAFWHVPGQGPTAGLGVWLQSSTPDYGSMNYWYAAGYNYGATTLALQVVILCLPAADVGAVTVVTQDLAVPNAPQPGNTAGNYVACPSGQKAVTGGAYWHRPARGADSSLSAVVQSSTVTTDGRGWYAAGANYSPDTLVMTIVVKCLPAGSVGTFDLRTAEPTSNNLWVDGYLACKTGFRVVGGGAFWHKAGLGPDATLDAYLRSSTATTDGRGWYAGGKQFQSGLHLQIVVLCVKPQ